MILYMVQSHFGGENIFFHLRHPLLPEAGPSPLPGTQGLAPTKGSVCVCVCGRGEREREREKEGRDGGSACIENSRRISSE